MNEVTQEVYYPSEVYRMAEQKNIISPLDVIARLGWNESDDLELKSGKGGLPRSLWETYSAMANTKGGVILLGVENDGTVTGLVDTNKIKKAFWDTINNRGKVSINFLEITMFEKLIIQTDG